MPVSDELDGQKFFTRINAKRAATPLLAALVVIEITDVIFAVDSVPAILAVSNEPYLVFASNAFAILGLRALYFLLATAKERFHYLSHALGGILIFVGIKMSISHWYHLNTYVSLAIIIVMLAAAIVFSVRRAKMDELDGGRPLELDGVGAFLAGADAHDPFDVDDPDLAVADLPGGRRAGDRVDDLVDPGVVDDDLDQHLRHEVDLVLGAAVGLGVAALTSEPTDLADRHAGDVGGLEGVLHLVQLERLDDCGDQLHDDAPVVTFVRFVKFSGLR